MNGWELEVADRKSIAMMKTVSVSAILSDRFVCNKKKTSETDVIVDC